MRTEKRLVLAMALVLLAAMAPGAMAEPVPAANPSFITVLCDWLQVLFGGPAPHDPPGVPPSFGAFIVPGG